METEGDTLCKKLSETVLHRCLPLFCYLMKRRRLREELGQTIPLFCGSGWLNWF